MDMCEPWRRWSICPRDKAPSPQPCRSGFASASDAFLLDFRSVPKPTLDNYVVTSASHGHKMVKRYNIIGLPYSSVGGNMRQRPRCVTVQVSLSEC